MSAKDGICIHGQTRRQRCVDCEEMALATSYAAGYAACREDAEGAARAVMAEEYAAQAEWNRKHPISEVGGEIDETHHHQGAGASIVRQRIRSLKAVAPEVKK